ncbi:hypothetical protein SRHO_G00081660 [Serrasalmus rhombeus]
MSEAAEQELQNAVLTPELREVRTDITLVGCGGVKVQPKCMYQLKMKVYGHVISVPTLVVPGQQEHLILGTNVIKYLVGQLKQTPTYWHVVNKPGTTNELEVEQFLDMLSGLNRWKGDKIPDVVGTVKLTQAVTLLPKHEHLVWGRLPVSSPISVGSTVLVEPPRSPTHKKNIVVGKVVASMTGDRWVPMRILNPSEKSVTLKKNSKVADVFPCMALEDLDPNVGRIPDEELRVQTQAVHAAASNGSDSSFQDALQKLGLSDLDIQSCEVSSFWKGQLLQLVCKYEDVFSKHKLDCGRARDFVHRIHLSDTRPFRLPYRRVPPGQYQKLRQVLSEMEEREIIRKSCSEWASLLVLVWKKTGDLRICIDYRWLNARTVKDAHPLPHQSAALKGKKGHARGAAVFRKLSPNDWRKEHHDSFEQLKAALLQTVALAHPDFSRPFILSTDASLDGLGAVLAQVAEGESQARPIAFASKALTRAQCNYPAHRLEFLALKWAVCDKFSHWLKGNTFTVWTDNNPLTYILTKPRLDACEQRWVAKLAPYDFSIQYIPGSKNVVADALSRQPFIRSPVGQRLVSESYGTLLEEAKRVGENMVQDAFKLSANCQTLSHSSSAELLQHSSLTSDEVSAILEGQEEWDKGAKERAISWLVHGVHQLAPPAHESTGYAPFFLMYRRIPRLPVDVMFSNIEKDNDITDYDMYVRRMRDDLKEALNLAQVNANLSQQRRADLYNRRAKGCDIGEGDQVLLANKGERGRRKLADTFRIRNTATGQEKIVHRNLLLQASFLPIETEDAIEPSFDDVSESCHEQSMELPTDGPMTGSDSCRIDRTADWVAEAIASSSCPEVQSTLIPENYLSEADSDTSAIESQSSCDTGAEDASEKGCDAEGTDVTHERLRDVDSVGPAIGEEGIGIIPPSASNPSPSNTVAQIRTRMEEPPPAPLTLTTEEVRRALTRVSESSRP